VYTLIIPYKKIYCIHVVASDCNNGLCRERVEEDLFASKRHRYPDHQLFPLLTHALPVLYGNQRVPDAVRHPLLQPLGHGKITGTHVRTFYTCAVYH